MKLTYLLLSPTFGMHQYTADLANRMAGEFEVHVVTTTSYPEGRYGPQVTVHAPVEIANTGFSPDSMRLGRLKRVKESLDSIGPSVVHITGPHIWNVDLVRWMRRRGMRVAHTIHDLDPHHGVGYGRLLHLWNWAIIRLADHIVVHGEIYRQRLIASGRRPEQITCTRLTHLFVGYEMGQALAAEQPEVRYEPVALFFGRQERYKGLDTLLEAFEMLNARHGSERPVRLVLAGPGSTYRHSHGDRLPGVERRDHLISDAEGLELFRRCGVVVLPYRDATQSAVIAAAYFFKKPVIVTAVGALAEYVQPDETGLIVAEGDAKALAEALMNVLQAPERAEALGRAGRAWYDEHRTRETLQLEGLYRRLVC